MEHEIIWDLLPLYHDGVCTPASRAAVEAHLPICADCRRALAEMDAPLPQGDPAAADDAAMVKTLSRAWRRDTWRARLRGAAVGVLACAALAGGYWALFQWQSQAVPTAVLEVTELSHLSDGRVLFHLYVDDERDLNRVDYDYENGACYVVPLRPVFCRERSTAGGLWDDDYLIDLTAAAQDGGEPCTAIYLGGEADAVLLWQEGMDLPAASAQVEAAWK